MSASSTARATPKQTLWGGSEVSEASEPTIMNLKGLHDCVECVREWEG